MIGMSRQIYNISIETKMRNFYRIKKQQGRTLLLRKEDVVPKHKKKMFLKITRVPSYL